MKMALEDLQILQAAEVLADGIWQEVSGWDKFSQDVVGKQLARAADSVGANIAEAFGRYHYGDKLQFLYYARGSLFETKYWINRALSRKLINYENTQNYTQKITEIAQKLNSFISTTKRQRPASGNTNNLYESLPIYETVNDPLFAIDELDWLQFSPDN